MNSAMSSWSSDLAAEMPALRYAASSRPCSASTWATTASLAARSVTSRTTNGQPSSAATDRLRSLSRSARTAVTSRSRSLAASARPKPPVPPVIRAMLPGERELTPASCRAQEAVEHADAELQRLDGDPLVDAVEQRGEVQLRRQLQRREAEAAHAEPLEALGVGAAAHGERHRTRAVVLGPESGDHRVDQRAVERRLHGLVVDQPLALDALADQRGELPLELLLLAVEEAPVDGGAGRAGDDVGLVAGVEHRRVGGVAQGRADHAGDAAEAGKGRLGVVGVDLDVVGVADRVEELAHRRGEHGGQPGRADARDRLAEPGDGVVVAHERAAPGAGARGR